MTEKESKIEKAITAISATPLEAGLLIEIKRFEDLFGVTRDTKIFGLLIAEFRRALYSKGFYLTGEGSTETGCYEIIDPRENHWVAKLAMARAERDLAGKAILLANTNQKGFSKLQKTRHENTLRAISLKLAAMQKAQEIEALLIQKKTEPLVELEEG